MTYQTRPKKFNPDRLDGALASIEEMAEFQRVATGQKYETSQREDGVFLNEATQRAHGLWRSAVCWTVERMQAQAKELAAPGCAQRVDKPEENSHSASPVAQQDERAMFDKWCASQDRSRSNQSEDWEVWQARAALSSKRQDAQGQKDDLNGGMHASIFVKVWGDAGGGDAGRIALANYAYELGRKSVAAPSVPTGGSIDTPRFWALLLAWDKATMAESLPARNAIIAHIDAHVATKVQAARDEASPSIEVAVELYCPVPDSPHASVRDRAVAARDAFRKGYSAGEKSALRSQAATEDKGDQQDARG